MGIKLTVIGGGGVLRHHPSRIREIKHLHMRAAVSPNQLTVLGKLGHRAHGKGKSGRSCGFLPQKPVGQGDPLVVHPFIILSHPDGSDDKICRIYTETDMRFFTKDLTKDMGCLLNEYLYYYF